jgi:archaellum component FlaG (FlaF/FlaG flagellin family)
MQIFLIFVVLVFSVALVVYASPIILFIVPLIVIGLVISYLSDSDRHHSNTVEH